MKSVESIKEIIENKKFNKSESLNKIVFVSKLGVVNNNLIVIFKDEVMKKPMWSMIEEIIEMNGDYYVYFDGRYDQEVEMGEYEAYKNMFSEKEWGDLFKGEGILNILEEYSFEEKGYYLDIHENLSTVTEKFNVVDIEEITR